MRRRNHAVVGDQLAIAVNCRGPHVQIEVGGAGKRLRAAFAELRSNALPGFVPMVVRFVDRRRWHYIDEDTRFARLKDALDALQGAPKSFTLNRFPKAVQA